MGSLSELPDFQVRIGPPDISPWVAGNTGTAGITTRQSRRDGPHVALLSLMHGNELAGAIVLDRLLRAGLEPIAGKLSFGFLNLAAFERFDPQRPTASRFLDEDMNRVWDEAILNGPRHSIELNRAREIRSFIDSVDVLLDLHSMLWPSEPLILSGAPEKGRALAQAIGTPSVVVADHGHVNGRRLIDYPRFASPATRYAACLVEAGQHWEEATVDTITASVAGLLHHLNLVAPDAKLPPPAAPQPVRLATVTTAVTARTSGFSFIRPFRGGEV
ncbi:MAG TPA: succinylglutamate desuccinylase/aspartoacylase family protein, partial [Rhodopila sp.]|nr:succinylglutamate desuccinylase/aspartoacylase family protein [Rhodopila sp.]